VAGLTIVVASPAQAQPHWQKYQKVPPSSWHSKRYEISPTPNRLDWQACVVANGTVPRQR
jgi:hypothetical protein